MKAVDKYPQVPSCYLDGVGNLLFAEHSSNLINKNEPLEKTIKQILMKYDLYEDYLYLTYLSKSGMLTVKDIEIFNTLLRELLTEKERIVLYSSFLFS